MSWIRYYRFVLFLLITLAGISCNQGDPEYFVQTLKTPSEEGGEPFLFTASDGSVYLSWIEYADDTTDVLLMTRLENGQWADPDTIASGSDWFVNWADFPSLVALPPDGRIMAAHWLEKSAAGTYDYDVHVSLSRDNGRNWDSSFVVHRDSIQAEHGFVSMAAISQDSFFISWLDGRYTKNKDGSGGGAMTLRGAVIDSFGMVHGSRELDGRVCDCCQTTAETIGSDILVAYRDRSESEVRDISIVRRVAGHWLSPQLVHADNWTIAGCPVNGPAMSVQDSSVALAWYTMAQDSARVLLSISKDRGQSFSDPIQLNDKATSGRVALQWMDENRLMATFVETTGPRTSVTATIVSSDLEIMDRVDIAEIGEGRLPGFPVLTINKGDAVIAFTQVDSTTKVATTILKRKP